MNFLDKFYLNDKFYLKLILLCLFSFITLFNRLNYSTIGYDDAFYAQRAKELLQNKDYFFIKPTYGYKIKFDNKPPIIYWLLAISGKVFGFKNWSMRLLPAFFGFLNVLLTFFVISKLCNNSTFGFLVGFILNFTQQFIYYSRSATPETVFCLFFWLSLFSFVVYIQKTNDSKYLLLIGICVGLAVITRQIFGFFPYIVVLAYVILFKQWHILKNKNLYIGFVISLFISLPWHIFMIVKYKSDFVNSYFGIISRYVFIVKTNWYEYIRKILENYWPWLPFLIVGFVGYNKYRNKDEFLKNPLFDISIFTIVLYLIFIHIPKYKAVQYLVPLYIPFALFSAYGIKTIEKNKNYVLSKIFVKVAIVLTFLWILFPILPETLDSKEFKELKKLFIDIKNINGEIISLDNENFWHFSNGLLFYLDKEVTVVNYEELLKLIYSKDKKFFILKKKDFNLLPEDIIKKLKIIKETDESMLFTNSS